MDVSKSISKGWVRMRERLIKENILVEKDKKLIFSEDTSFNSTSAASSILLGRQSAGPNEWIDDKGKSFKENQEETIEND